jgi:steroid delta-isomerase-like uncharacterized protein
MPADLHGPEEFKQFVRMYRGAFPDLALTIEDQIAEGDLVGSRHTSTGTHTNEFQGIPPTGKAATITGMTLTRVADGKIVEAWTCWDALGMFEQLGLAGGGPPPGASREAAPA